MLRLMLGGNGVEKLYRYIIRTKDVEIHNSEMLNNSAQIFNVETLKREKTTGEQSFTIQWISKKRL